MSSARISVSVVGASGYAGGELLRLLHGHPHVLIKQATSTANAGRGVALVHPNLRGLTSLTFVPPSELEPCDLLFVAVPNGASMRTMESWLPLAGKIIDLGADFRLRDPEAWRTWYGTEHAAPGLLPDFTPGIPELYADRIREARLVAGPGCEAIASILSLLPFIRRGLIRGREIIIDAKMGSSQAGRSPSEASHHPERAGAVRSYKPTGHRHAAEVEQALGAFDPGIAVAISATAVEMVRGILVTIHARLSDPSLGERDIWQAVREEYRDKPFVRIVKQTRGLYRYPEPKILQGTNFCEIGFEKEERTGRLVILGAVDNLVKGTSGNGVQCMNLMHGWPETTGLEFPGLHPV